MGYNMDFDIAQISSDIEEKSMADPKRLVFSIIRFLEDQTKSKDLEEDTIESLEVAKQCLETAYGLDLQDEETIAKYQVQRNLLDIFNAQLQIEPDSVFSSLSLHEPTPEQKEQAEALKSEGNDFMKVEKFSDALQRYTDAIKLDNKNPVYYCNRAAAYSKLNSHEKAIDDCQKAIAIDSEYSKAYGRMGIAYTALEDHESALECYTKALSLDPGNQSYQNNKEIAEQKLKDMAQQAAQAGFNMGSMGNMMGGLPGMDMGSMLQNPAFMNIAQTMMSNPQVQSMMNNLVSGMSGGGGQQPDLGAFVQASQQFAQRLQSENPELVAQLRQMGQQPQRDPPSDQGGDQQQPPPSQ